MGVRERRDREREQARRKIMDVARHLFAAHGYDAVSMRKVAEAVEYSPTAIYLHFKDKQELLRQVCNDDFARFYDTQAAAAEQADPIDRIRQMGRAYVRFAVEHPNHFRRMFLDPPKVDLDADKLAKCGDPTADSYALFRSQVQAAKTRWRPEFAKDIELATQILWAAVHGAASLALAHGGPDAWVELKPIETLTDSTIESILRGLMPDKPKARR